MVITNNYHTILIISTGLILVQKSFVHRTIEKQWNHVTIGLFFRGAYYQNLMAELNCTDKQ